VDVQHDVHQTICTVDIAGYGGMDRTRPNYVALRAGMFESVQQAFAEAGIPWAECYQQDVGDSILALAPPTVPKAAFAGTLPRALAAALRAHNEAHPPEERIKLRLALHAGEVTFDEWGGVASQAVIKASRLLDAKPLKEALAGSPGTLAMIVSEWFYDEVIRHRVDHEPDAYRKVTVVVKETTTTGWIRLPDHVLPPASLEPSASVPAVVPNGEPVLAPVVLRPASPEFYQVIEALEEIPCMRDERERSFVVDQLRFAGTVRYFPSRRAHLTSILRTCIDYDTGVVELVTVISGQEAKGSLPMRRLLALLFGGTL
jgi:class 3 adenylate cyclase